MRMRLLQISAGHLSLSLLGLLATLFLLALSCDLFTVSRSMLPEAQRKSKTTTISIRLSNDSATPPLTDLTSRSAYNASFSTSTTMDPQEEFRLFLNLPSHSQPENDKRISLTTKRHANNVQWGFCGDGIVDAKEDCDCGGLINCSKVSRSCCNASTCSFVMGAECAEGLCCSQDCKLKRSRQVCRPAKNSCDVSEYCTGLIAHCSPDAFKRNGDVCGAGQGYCFNRVCMTRNDQCEDVWGLHSFTAKDECYFHFNRRGLFNGNCGLAADALSFKACATEDVMCGALQCKGGGQSALVSPNTVQSYATSIVANVSGLIYQCKTNSPEVPNHANVQATLVRDGTKCGSDKICLKGHCVSFRHLLSVDTCPGSNASSTCSGHGTCTDLNICSCDVDFSGSDCSLAVGNQSSRMTAGRNNNMLQLRRGLEPPPGQKRKTVNEVVDNDTLQVIVIIMSMLLLGATVAIMSLTCCRGPESATTTSDEPTDPASANTEEDKLYASLV